MNEVSVIKPLGIKELKDTIEALLEVSLKITSVLKDGYQATDLALIFELFTKDEEMKKKIALAYDGISKVGGEVRDIDISEGIELTVSMIQYVPKFIAALQKDK